MFSQLSFLVKGGAEAQSQFLQKPITVNEEQAAERGRMVGLFPFSPDNWSKPEQEGNDDTAPNSPILRNLKENYWMFEQMGEFPS